MPFSRTSHPTEKHWEPCCHYRSYNVQLRNYHDHSHHIIKVPYNRLNEGLSCSEFTVIPAPVKHWLYIFKFLTLAITTALSKDRVMMQIAEVNACCALAGLF
jgi:hypothetical protein